MSDLFGKGENRTDGVPDNADAGGRNRWPAACGTVAGLGFGMVLVQALAVAAFLNVTSGLAEVVWEVGSPLAAIAGAVGGAALFGRYLQHSTPAAIGVAVAMLAFEAVASVWLGVPWM
ncbi:MAG: hypothetical protein D6806_01335 [Deltaproteobacteria bacterium]|nr:MAG: hypothetical protein D6806_01335 [Deltaproteobacteria bacterium]